MNALTHRLDEALDRAEQDLPPVLAAPLRLQRTVAERAVDVTTSAATSLWNSARAVKGVQARAYNTVAGTVRWAAKTTLRAGRTVAGQTTAQTRLFARATRAEAQDLADSASGAVEDLTTTAVDVVDAVDVAIGADAGPTNEAYDDLTKDELYRRAKALDIEGRSQMSKDELVKAVREAA